MKDSTLITNAQKDPQAFEVLYDEYAQKIFNYFYFHTNRDKDTAEDLMQETFIRAFDHMTDFKDRGFAYSTYLFTIAHNLLVNHYRNQHSVPLFEAEKIPYEITEEIEHQSEAEALSKAIDELPRDEQEVINLKYERGLSVRTIAQMLHKTENAVKLSLFRIRNKLRVNKYLWA